MGKQARVRVLVGLAAVVFAAAWLPTASAQVGPAVELVPSSAHAGDVIRIIGSGFQPGTVGIHVDAVVAGGELTSLQIGPRDDGFEVRIRVPDLAPGDHQMIACRDLIADQCRESASAQLVVNAPRPPTTTSTTSTPVGPTTTSAIALGTTTAPPPPPPTAPGAVVVPTTAVTPTVPPNVQASIPDGPDPTYNPTPTGLAVTTTTAQPDEATNIPATDYPDLYVDAIEVTQGIQNLSSKMPLVAERRTWVRVHPATTPQQSWAPIDGLLLLERPGKPAKVITPENGPIATNHDRAEWNAALNFLLPHDYVGTGTLKLTAAVWVFNPSTLTTSEPNPANNQAQHVATFREADVPKMWLIALDDGGGPGPTVNDLTPLLGFAPIAYQDLLEFHPIAHVDFEAFPDIVEPGVEATEPGTWILDIEGDEGKSRRHEPNLRMKWIAQYFGLLEDASVMGVFDASIPSAGFTGWAKHGVSWSKPVAGTPAHELGHNRGLKHVACKDSDGDGVGDELKGGALDPKHPNGLPPQCSLAPINPDGYFGFTTYRNPVAIYSNDPMHPQAAYPFMSYKTPGWTDPYYYCTLLNAYGVNCSHALIGVPPKNLSPAADCTPQVLDAAGIAIEFCIGSVPSPTSPFTGVDVAVESIVVTTEHTELVLPNDADGWLIASGSVDTAAGTATLTQAATFAELGPASAHWFVDGVQAAASGDETARARLRLLGADGRVLADVPVDLDGAGHGGGGERSDTVGYFQAIPFVDGAVAVELTFDGATVARRDVSNAAPAVSDVAVTTAGSGTAVAWQANDPDDDPLTYSVLWSADGATWMPAAMDIGQTELIIAADQRFPGGDDVRVKVVANDGVRTGEAISAPFQAPGHEPLVVISGVPDGATIEQYDVVELAVHAMDPEDGNLDGESLQWRSDLDGALASGRVVSTRDLSVGHHTISVEATDADGNVAEAQVAITVVGRTSPTRYTETPDDAAVEFLTGNASGGVASAATTPSGTGSGAIAVVIAAALVAAVLASGTVFWRRRFSR